MKRKVILSSFVFSILFVFFVSSSVFAISTGTMNFKAVDSTGTKVDNLEVKIYKVANVDNPLIFVEDSFKDFNPEDYSDVNIKKMQEYAKDNVEPILIKTTDVNGEFNLKLETGKYLLVQNNKQEDCTMQTMYVSLPETMPNSINYNVTVKPKIVVIKKIIDEDILKANDEVLPQTGILDWPIVVLAVSGIAIFSISWIVFYTKKKIR